VSAEGCATVPSKHQTTAEHQTALADAFHDCNGALDLLQTSSAAMAQHLLQCLLSFSGWKSSCRYGRNSQVFKYIRCIQSCFCFTPACCIPVVPFKLLQCISIYRKLPELLLLQLVVVPAVTTNVTAPAISATGVLPVLAISPTANADNTPVI
jgi:hypothetical protein